MDGRYSPHPLRLHKKIHKPMHNKNTHLLSSYSCRNLDFDVRYNDGFEFFYINFRVSVVVFSCESFMEKHTQKKFILKFKKPSPPPPNQNF